jgi:ABC-2 type transport system permease protein
MLVVSWSRSAMQYRATFVMTMLNGALVAMFGLVEVLVIFANVKSLAGFGIGEMLYLSGTAQTGFAVSEVLFHGSSYVARRIRLGTFDSMLIRPVGVLTQVFADQFNPMRLSGVLPALGMLAAGLIASPVHWTPQRVLIVPYTVVCSTAIWGAMAVATAAYQIIVTDGDQLMSAVTYGGEFLTSYPLSVYGRGPVFFLTFGFPLAFVNWEPTLYLLDHPDPLGLPLAFRFLAPAAAALMWLAALAAWRAGLRRHRSTGS